MAHKKKKHKNGLFSRMKKWGLLSKLQLVTALISGFVLLMSRTPWSHTIIRSHGLLLTTLAALHIIEKIIESRQD